MVVGENYNITILTRGGFSQSEQTEEIFQSMILSAINGSISLGSLKNHMALKRFQMFSHDFPRNGQYWFTVPHLHIRYSITCWG